MMESLQYSAVWNCLTNFILSAFQKFRWTKMCQNRERCFSSCQLRNFSLCPTLSPVFFSLSHARDMTKNIFLYFYAELKTYHLSFSVCKSRC